VSCRSEGVVKRKKDRGCKEGRAQRRHRGRNSGRCGKRQRLMSARAYCFLLQSQTSMAIDSVKNSSQTNHICSQIYTKHVCGTYALFPFEIRIGPWHVGGLSGSLWTCYAPPCVTHALSTRRWRAINTLSELGWSSFAAHFAANAARKYRLCAVFRANLGCA